MRARGARGGCKRGRKGRFVRTATEHHVGSGGQEKLPEGLQDPIPREHLGRGPLEGCKIRNSAGMLGGGAFCKDFLWEYMLTKFSLNL